MPDAGRGLRGDLRRAPPAVGPWAFVSGLVDADLTEIGRNVVLAIVSGAHVVCGGPGWILHTEDIVDDVALLDAVRSVGRRRVRLRRLLSTEGSGPAL